jgi:hypothetical protein
MSELIDSVIIERALHPCLTTGGNSKLVKGAAAAAAELGGGHDGGRLRVLDVAALTLQFGALMNEFSGSVCLIIESGCS